MHKPIDVGTNRTGVETAPFDSRRTAAGTAAGPVNGHALEAERIRWSRTAVPLGTMPPPGSIKGGITTAFVFVDKLTERLAFERTSSRLYDALLAKLAAASIHAGGPTRAEIEKIRDDERRHHALVRDALVQCGADPTAMTPGADVACVASMGWIQVLTDPRTTLAQCLGVILGAEAADEEGWTLLISLAEELGFHELAHAFSDALAREELHAALVRTWLTNAVLGQSGAEPVPHTA